MGTIHQIYCTHCTHGNSALERREGELARRMLGYSARAGSLEARDLRRYYRQIERYVYYYLPRDTPGEAKLRLTASSAPRRLVFHPSTGGLQVVGQVCYRQTDTEGRPGSYFAHVLFREEKDEGPRWSQLDCLKLFGGPGWVEEDSPHIPFLLQPLASLDQMLGPRRAAVDDHVFLSFLTTPAGGSFDDPAGVIPDRWRRMEAVERCGLFTEAFRGFLEISGERRESLLLVIESSMAALVFYGIMRLVPAGPVRDRVSFSTFEPNTDRVGTSLAATSFYDPEKTDLRPDAYRSRGFAINTFSGRRTESRRPQAQYARTMVWRLVEQGWEAVDWSLASFESAGARGVEDLEALAAVDHLVPALFDPRAASLSDQWRRSPMTTDYLRQAVVRQLSALSDPAGSLGPIVGRPAHQAILELIATEPETPGVRGVVEFLLARLPGEKIAELIRLDGVSSEAKVDVLVRHVTSHGELPAGCDHLWNEVVEAGRTPGSGPSPDRAAGPLLGRVLSRLDLNTLGQFYERVAGQHAAAFLAGLTGASKRHPATRAGLTHIVGTVDDQVLLSLFRSHGPAFFQAYPDDEPALGVRLHAMVGSLAQHVRQFPERLDLVLAGRHLLPDEDQDLLTAWANCRRAMLDVDRLQGQRSGILRQRPIEELEAACRRMAEAAAKAMPPDHFDDDPRGTQKQSCLRQIGERVLGGRSLLPPGVWQHDALWEKIAWCFRNGAWPAAPLRKMSSKSRSSKSLSQDQLPSPRLRGEGLGVRGFHTSSRLGWIIIGAIVAVVLVVSVIGALRSSKRAESDSGSVAETSGRQMPTAAPASPGIDSPERSAREAQRKSEAEEASKGDEAETNADVPWELDEEPTRPAAEETLLEVAEPQVAVSQPSQDPTIESVRPAVETWKREADEFARVHAGKFFDEEPLADGELRIPADALPASPDGGELFLGGGVLHLDHAIYPFGAGFDTKPPVFRHEVPQLANALGFPSVYVELQSRQSGWAVVLGLVPNSMPPDAEARMKAIVEKHVEAEVRAYEGQLREHNEQGLAALKQQCRRISVIVYRARGGPGSSSISNHRSSIPTRASLEGRFRVERRPAQGLNPPAIAQVRPVVAGDGGKPLPPWYDEVLVAGCLIVEQDENGFLLRNIEMRDIDAEEIADIFEKTATVRLRFEFSRRSRDPFDAQRRAVIATASHVVDRIEKGKQYTIKLELTKEGLDRLRLVAEDRR